MYTSTLLTFSPQSNIVDHERFCSGICPRQSEFSVKCWILSCFTTSNCRLFWRGYENYSIRIRGGGTQSYGLVDPTTWTYNESVAELEKRGHYIGLKMLWCKRTSNKKLWHHDGWARVQAYVGRTRVFRASITAPSKFSEHVWNNHGSVWPSKSECQCTYLDILGGAVHFDAQSRRAKKLRPGWPL